jgi:NAD(P)-dependent dehydrogenase (short-subunit alcohol dehydrogenase family)
MGGRALVTGGSSGIGLTIAESLGRRGFRVVLLARGREGLQDAAAQVPGCAGLIAADVSDAAETRAAIEQADDMLGGLDVVVANAGAGAYGPFLQSAPDDYGRTVATTLLGVLNTAHAAIPLLDRSRGSLVVVGSVAGRLPTPWLSSYAAAKHGARGFVRSLRCELRATRTPVAVTLVAPGPVNTPFWRRARTPDGRLPPELRGAYPPGDVAREVLRAIEHPRRTERTVGGLFAVTAFIDGLAPNLTLVPVGVAARLGWRARDRHPPSSDDALSMPTTEAVSAGGLHSRPSILSRLRDRISGRP